MIWLARCWPCRVLDEGQARAAAALIADRTRDDRRPRRHLRASWSRPWNGFEAKARDEQDEFRDRLDQLIREHVFDSFSQVVDFGDV